MREKIGIVGLGYIGIQLAITFGKERDTIGLILIVLKLMVIARVLTQLVS